MPDLRKHSNTSNLIRVALKNSSTGAPLTGLTEASSGLIIGTIADVEATTTRYRASSSEVETISTLGTFSAPTSGKCRFKEVDSANHPGLYEIQIADARFSVSNARRLVVSVSGATNLLVTDYEIRLVLFDPDDSVRMGMTALPPAAAEASGGLPTLSAAQASNGTIQANVHRWLTGTPNALQSGRVDSYLGAVASGVIAAASFAANALDAVWSAATRVLTAGTNIALAKGTGVTGFNDLSAAQVNAEVDTALADYDGPTHAELTSEIDDVQSDIAALNNLSAADVNAEVDAALADYDGPTYTELLNLFRLAVRKDSAIATDLSSLLTAINADLSSGGGAFNNTTEALEALRDRGDAAWTTAVGFSTHSAADVWAVGTRTLTSFGSLVADVATAVWGAATRTLSAFGFTPLLDAAYDAAKTAASQSSVDALPSAADNADAVWEETLADHSGTSGSTAEALNAAGAAGDPWSTTLPGSYTGTQAGKIVGDNLDATVSSRAAASLFTGITSVAQWLGLLAGKQTGNSTARTEVRATGAGSGTYDETTDSQEAIRDRGDNAWTTAVGFSTHTAADVWAVGTRTLTSFGTLVADVATAVWGAATRTLSAFGFSVTVGTNTDKTGYGLADDAITAGKFDESTAFPLKSADAGSTAVARTGADGDTLETLSDQIDGLPSASTVAAQITSDHGAGSYVRNTEPDNASIASAAADAASLEARVPANPAAVGDIPTAAENADKILLRSLAGGADGGRTVQDALRFNRNKFTIVSGTLTVYEEDDTTVAWTAAITQTPGDPVSASDPA